MKIWEINFVFWSTNLSKFEFPTIFFFFILINSNRKLDYIIEVGILSRIEREWQSCDRPPHKFLFLINLRIFCETDLISNAHLQNPIQIMWSLSLFPQFDPTHFVFSFNPITVFLYRPFAIFVVCFRILHFESSISLSFAPLSIFYLLSLIPFHYFPSFIFISTDKGMFSLPSFVLLPRLICSSLIWDFVVLHLCVLFLHSFGYFEFLCFMQFLFVYSLFHWCGFGFF